MSVWKPQIGKPRFCKSCGTALVPNKASTSYDEITGEAIYPFEHTPICPNGGCWRSKPSIDLEWAGRYP